MVRPRSPRLGTLRTSHKEHRTLQQRRAGASRPFFPTSFLAAAFAIFFRNFRRKIRRKIVPASFGHRSEIATRIELGRDCASMTCDPIFTMFWGEQPPFTPIGCGGRSFLVTDTRSDQWLVSTRKLEQGRTFRTRAGASRALFFLRASMS